MILGKLIIISEYQFPYQQIAYVTVLRPPRVKGFIHSFSEMIGLSTAAGREASMRLAIITLLTIFSQSVTQSSGSWIKPWDSSKTHSILKESPIQPQKLTQALSPSHSEADTTLTQLKWISPSRSNPLYLFSANHGQVTFHNMPYFPSTLKSEVRY